ncbi:MAG: hypothetical protein ACI9VS_004220 [Candidatus Binatia bacterium]|jgi:hypothetical protein|tara:strand:- start:133 stop:390 length:258 start_codon:yes stop_codon:yes gene_type:complete
MEAFRLFVDQEAIDFLNSLPRRRRDSLYDRLRQIREHPGSHSDYQETDSTGRFVDISICGRHAIHYWIDHADRHIKVLEISSADS